MNRLFNQDSHIDNLPDAFAKSSTSNNYKLLELSDYNVNKFRDTLTQLDNSLDLDNATGALLDMYGELVGQARGQCNDAQYLLLIKTRIGINMSDGTHSSIVKILASLLNCDTSDIQIYDNGTATVKIGNIPTATINEAGFTTSQLTQLISALMPTGVTLEAINYSGTFRFANYDGETGEYGFVSSEGDTDGGQLGALSSNDSSAELPI